MTTNLIVFEDVDQQEGEEEEAGYHVTGGAVLETESSDAATSQTSDSEHSDLPDTSDAENPLPVVSVLGESKQHVLMPVGPDEAVMQEIEVETSDADVSHVSDSGASDSGPSDSAVSDSDGSAMQLPTVKADEPSSNTRERGRSTKRRARVSPEMVLRGLICDARPEMIHFTLPHSLFSRDELRKGLEYAYSIEEAATCRLAILELLDDDTTDTSATELRRWIALIDNTNPKTRLKTHIAIIFNFLSVEEMKAALKESVQSRLVVEREIEETRESLIRNLGAKERAERSATDSAKEEDHTRELECSTRNMGVPDDNEAAFDAFLTTVMVVLIGALYLRV